MPRRTLAAIASLALLSGCDAVGLSPIGVAGDTAPASQSLAAQCAGDPAQAQAMQDAVNAARSVEGKITLVNNPRLAEIAQSHACDMVRMGQATVAGSNGSNVVDRARAVGYPSCGVVQLVTVGGDPAGVVNGWLTSQPHREQVLGQLSTDIGAGMTTGHDGRRWWSVVMGHDCR